MISICKTILSGTAAEKIRDRTTGLASAPLRDRAGPTTSPALPVPPAVPAEPGHDPTAPYPGPGQIGYRVGSVS